MTLAAKGLIEVWKHSPDWFAGKKVDQVIKIAGGGKLGEGNEASKEFRALLGLVPSSLLRQYATQCLEPFDSSGFALQDVVNELGQRLDFKVTHGRYRGTHGVIGFDGLWESADGRAIVVEVKTTATYRFELDTISSYRTALIKEGRINEAQSSILVVVGREETRELESQIRGSRHACDVRLISVEGLLRLMQVKEELDDPPTVRRIVDVLTPQEFTRVDGIIDLVFSTAKDVKQDEEEEVGGDGAEGRAKPVTFNEACVARLAAGRAETYTKRSRVTFTSADGKRVVVCLVSREHGGLFWYTVYPHHRDTLTEADDGVMAFGCGSPETLLVLPIKDFAPILDALGTRPPDDDKFRWQLKIRREGERLVVHTPKAPHRLDLTKYLF